jgi:hypothetical protein
MEVMGVRRSSVVVVLLVTCGIAAAFGVGASLREDVYVTSVDVQLQPITASMLYDLDASTWSATEARRHEQALLDGDDLREALAAELTFPHQLDVEWAAADRLRFEGRAETAELAAATAVAAGAVYGSVREAEAQREVDALVVDQEAQVERLEAEAAGGGAASAAALSEARQRLELAQQAQVAVEAGTAYITAEVEVPCCPAGLSPARVTTVGVLVGLLVGLAVAWLVETAERGPRGRLAVVGAKVLGAAPAVARGPAPVEAPPRRRLGWLHDHRAPFVLLAVLALARFVLLAVLGTNLVLDDLSLSYFAEQGGVWDVVPSGQDLYLARPGAWLTFTFLYGAFGGHPLLLLVAVTVGNLLVAWVLLLLMRRFVADRTALWVAALWVVLPTHTTLTAWAGTTQIVVGLLLLLVGALAFVRGRALLGGLAMAASVLCYEIAIPAALLVPLVVATPLVPLRSDRAPDRALGVRERVLAAVPVVLSTAWSLTHSVYDVDPQLPDIVEVWNAHLGLGLWGSTSTPNQLVVLSGALVAGLAATGLVAWAFGQRGRGDGPSLVLAGLLLVGVSLPVAFTLGVMPLGFEDRVLGISTIGSALVLVGIGTWLWPRARNVAVVGGAALLVTCVVGQVVSLRSWSRAGDDVVALVRYVDALPDPESTHVWVEGGPLNRNGVIGASSPTGGANEAYLLRHPDADPDGPGVGTVATGSVTIADGSGAPPPDGVLVVTWDQVLRGPPDPAP